MTILVTTRGHSPNIDFEIDRVEHLLADLKRIRDGIAPSLADLAVSPVIDKYEIGFRHVPCLVGHVTGHPHLRGKLSITSDLWVIAPTHGWARTLSRFYMLGQLAKSKALIQ